MAVYQMQTSGRSKFFPYCEFALGNAFPAFPAYTVWLFVLWQQVLYPLCVNNGIVQQLVYYAQDDVQTERSIEALGLYIVR